MNDTIRVLVVDDHTVVRKGLCSLLSAEKYEIEVIGEAANGLEAIEKTRLLDPDVILLDLAMPVMDGLETIPIIKNESPNSRILVLTSFAEEGQVVEAIASGAMGYIMKDASPDELVSTIQHVYQNRVSLPQELASMVLQRRGEIQSKPHSDSLTDREKMVLRCVARGLSNKQIANDLGISSATVRTHISNLLRKLSLENRTQLALYAQEHKIV